MGGVNRKWSMICPEVMWAWLRSTGSGLGEVRDICDVQALCHSKVSDHQKCQKRLPGHFLCQDTFTHKNVWSSKVSDMASRTFLKSRHVFTQNFLFLIFK